MRKDVPEIRDSLTRSYSQPLYRPRQSNGTSTTIVSDSCGFPHMKISFEGIAPIQALRTFVTITCPRLYKQRCR